MTDNPEEDFFTVKHARLTNIAFAANLFAWIVFIVNILFVGARFIQVQNSYMVQSITGGQSPDFFGMLGKNPLYTASFIMDLVSIFLRGVVYGLLLKGISLGLNMIVETDLNYKEKVQAGNNE
jgi:hypothetical protein